MLVCHGVRYDSLLKKIYPTIALSGLGEKVQVLVSTDLEGGHFRSGDSQQRAEQRAFELGFVLDALGVECEDDTVANKVCSGQ